MIFKPIEYCDIEHLRAIRNRDEIRLMMNNTCLISQEMQEKWFELIQNDLTQRHYTVFLNDEIIGSVNFKKIDTTTPEWGFYCNKKGCGTQMLEKALDLWFDDCDVLYAQVLKMNQKSIHLHQKLGFEMYRQDETRIFFKKSRINFLCIIQARMSSTRLPGKVLYQNSLKQTMLATMINRLKKTTKKVRFVVATSTNSDDDLIEEECKKINCLCFRGSLENVLSRFYECYKIYTSDYIIRLTADCPLISHEIIDDLIDLHLKTNADYTNNCNLDRTYPHGFDAEIFSPKMLENAALNATSKEDLEHVTPYIKRNAPNQSVLHLNTSQKHIRITLDYHNDFLLIDTVLNALGADCGQNDIISYFAQNTHILNINRMHNSFLPLHYGRHDISKDDIACVVDVLQNKPITQGGTITEFENAISSYTGAKYATVVNSATSALHIALLALGVKEGDVVWTSANSFVASANCALYCNATVDFVDINEDDFNIDVELLEEKLKTAIKLPKVLIPVHFGGKSCDMKRIKQLSQKYGFFVLEDASHAIGGFYNAKPIGSCEFCDACVFSFHPVKIITTGEGGAIVTNNTEIAKKTLMLRTHGITKNKADLLDQSQDNLYFEQQMLGFNYRMTDIQASLGVSQIKRLNEFVQKRHKIAAKYKSELADLPIAFQNNAEGSSYHLFVICTDKKAELLKFLNECKIFASAHYRPIYLHPYYQNLGFVQGLCKKAEKYYTQALSLPIYPLMNDYDVDYVIQMVRQFFKS